MIILWSGSVATIPSGWAICDGTSGTPDLRNRFIVGAGSTYAVNATGGSADAIVVSHSHTFSGTTSTAGDHVHNQNFNNQPFVQSASTGPTASGQYPSSATAGTLPTTQTQSAGSHNHTYSGTTSSSGSSGTNANLPPYYALAYIMKL
jgi:microcystin-dependent protein